MDGLHIGKKKIIEGVIQKSGELNLLARGDGVEIMVQKINCDKIFTISASEIDEMMEFFYILEGSIVCEQNGEKNYLKQGDYFYVHHLKEDVIFKTINEVTLLWISTKPVFHYISNSIKELTKIVEKVEQKDIYTYDHSKRVKEYSIKIAEKMKISKERLEDITWATIFHDIGKVSVPDEVLNKPGRLTDEEMECIKKHTIDGKEMVKGTYYHNIGKIIEQHHERLDGSGYPNGLKRDEILIEAKIIAVADSYDAMTSDRVYRKGKPPLAAIEEIKSLSSKYYDEHVVKAFEEVLKEEGII